MNSEKFKYSAVRDALARENGKWKENESNGISSTMAVKTALEELKYKHSVKERFHELAVKHGKLELWPKLENITPRSLHKMFSTSPLLNDFYRSTVEFYGHDDVLLCFNISLTAARLGVGIEEAALMISNQVRDELAHHNS